MSKKPIVWPDMMNAEETRKVMDHLYLYGVSYSRDGKAINPEDVLVDKETYMKRRRGIYSD